MPVGLGDATVTVLRNKEVLVAGGRNSAGKPVSTAELYDPTTNTWKVTGSMHLAR
jgi:hypothetical protein